MNRLGLIVREIKNWLFLKRTIKKESSNPLSTWNKFNLRYNWYGRIYTVISLKEEDMGEHVEVQNWKAMDIMKPINAYLTSLDLQEIVFPSIEKIPNSRSYLVVYSPLIQYLTWEWIFWNLIKVSALIAGIIFLTKYL